MDILLADPCRRSARRRDVDRLCAAQGRWQWQSTSKRLEPLRRGLSSRSSQQMPLAIRWLDLELRTALALGATGYAAQVLVAGEIALKRSLVTIAQELAVFAFAAIEVDRICSGNWGELYVLICWRFFSFRWRCCARRVVRSVLSRKPIHAEALAGADRQATVGAV